MDVESGPAVVSAHGQSAPVGQAHLPMRGAPASRRNRWQPSVRPPWALLCFHRNRSRSSAGRLTVRNLVGDRICHGGKKTSRRQPLIVISMHGTTIDKRRFWCAGWSRQMTFCTEPTGRTACALLSVGGCSRVSAAEWPAPDYQLADVQAGLAGGRLAVGEMGRCVSMYLRPLQIRRYWASQLTKRAAICRGN
jgi:hypothetical protein